MWTYIRPGASAETACLPVIHPHQRCGYSDSPFARIHYFYTAGSGNGLEGAEMVCPPKLTLRKRHFFVIEKCIEDVKQEEKDVPDLLEPIMEPPGLVKEELRLILFKSGQFKTEITKTRASTFWMFPAGGQDSLLAQ